jgi:signal transduction histidine kinase
MESWIIGARLVILLYCIVRYVQGDMVQIPLVVLLLLIYISLDVLGYIFKNIHLQMAFWISSITLLVISAHLVHPLFCLLLVMDILELVSSFTGDVKYWIISIAVPAIFFEWEIIPEYMLAALLSLLVFLLTTKLYESISSLIRFNEKLKDQNDELNMRLEAGSEYESQLRYLSQLEERNSMAQKIHDRVGHTIAGSIIQLEAAGMIIGKDQDRAAGIIAAVTENLKEGMESIRSTLRSIKPAPEQLGIGRLKLMLEEFSMNQGIKTALSYNGNLEKITHLQWKIIMDNTKEALTNVLKYSFASSIQVSLEVMNRIIKTEVRDNGKGAFEFTKGMGLSGMEERTGSAGGKLIVDGSRGFSVITILPVDKAVNQ